MLLSTDAQSSTAGKVLFLDLENQLMPMPLGLCPVVIGAVSGQKVLCSYCGSDPNQ